MVINDSNKVVKGEFFWRKWGNQGTQGSQPFKFDSLTTAKQLVEIVVLSIEFRLVNCILNIYFFNDDNFNNAGCIWGFKINF